MDPLIAFLKDQFAAFGPVEIRRMFGGAGIYHRGVMFALASGDALYLKTAGGSERAFIARGLPPFEYERRGKRVRLSYYQAPPEAMDDPEELAAWAREAYRVAVRAATGDG